MVDEQPLPDLPWVRPADIEIRSLITALGYYKDLLGANEAQQVLAQGYCDLDVFEEIADRFATKDFITEEDYDYIEGLFQKYNIERRS